MKSENALRGLLGMKPKLTLAVAESLTCGHVQAMIGAVSGASGFFLGGMTAYSLEQKVRHLGVNRAHVRLVDGASPRVAVEMAQGACELFNADLAVATTGYAQANRAIGVKAPLAWWAICHRQRGGGVAVVTGQITLPARTGRVAAQEKISAEVLRELVGYLREFRQL